MKLIVQRIDHPLFRPSVCVAAAYALFMVLLTLVHHYDIYSYVHIGTIFSQHNPRGSAGYDGQFYYQLARDPLHAYQFMDNAPYRYQRIVYPLLVGILSAGQAALIPYMLLLVNFVSIVLSVELAARMLAKHGVSPWYSLALGLYFGQAAAFIFDTTEPLTCLLLCLGLWLVEQEYFTLAALSMGLAVLSRETAILFPLGYAVFYLHHKRWRELACFIFLALLPLLTWYLILWMIFGKTGLEYAPPFAHLPFGGIFYFFSNQPLFWGLIALMFVPTVGGWMFAGREIWLRRWSYLLLIWLLALLLETFMAPVSYQEFVSCGRLSIGLVLATLLYGWQTGNTLLLKASQFYTVTFPFYVLGVLVTTFVPT